jgi:hypothetical protein
VNVYVEKLGTNATADKNSYVQVGSYEKEDAHIGDDLEDLYEEAIGKITIDAAETDENKAYARDNAGDYEMTSDEDIKLSGYGTDTSITTVTKNTQA